MYKRTISKKMISFLNKIVPKKNMILFDSYPDFCDNSMALYKYIINNRKDICDNYKLIWAYTNERFLQGGGDLNSDTRIIQKKSLKGIMIFLLSKYVISTHGYFTGVYSGKNQIQVNLWHGCGYKNLTDADRGWRADYNIVTANSHKKLYSEFFDLKEENVFITGYPRNDTLFEVHNALIKLGIDKGLYNKVILWMPTYRKASQGHEGIDGDEKSFVPYNLTLNEIENLNQQLIEDNKLMLVKLHPMESASLEKLSGYSNIYCITSESLSGHNIQLYELLTESDCLLCDYSSLVVDYLLLDKPIGMVLSDKKEYSESRGFVFNPVEGYFPGPIITNMNELLAYLQNANEIDLKWYKKRLELKDFFHKYKDGNSSKRVTELFWG